MLHTCHGPGLIVMAQGPWVMAAVHICHDGGPFVTPMGRMGGSWVMAALHGFMAMLHVVRLSWPWSVCHGHGFM